MNQEIVWQEAGAAAGQLIHKKIPNSKEQETRKHP